MITENIFQKKKGWTVVFAALFTISVLVLGYVMLGLLPMFLFAFGFLGGFILWLIIPSNVTFSSIRVPYFLTLVFFIVHKWEERHFDFFPALSKLTGVPVPETDSVLVYLLYAFAAAWLLIPFLINRKRSFGYYLAWTFFTAMGVTELAHFFFPFFTNESYGYFPGMGSVVLLAPFAWWGMYRLSRKDLILNDLLNRASFFVSPVFRLDLEFAFDLQKIEPTSPLIID